MFSPSDASRLLRVQDDLVFLPPRVASSMANIGPLVLCTRVTNAITYTDPTTKRSATTEVCQRLLVAIDTPSRLHAFVYDMTHCAMP